MKLVAWKKQFFYESPELLKNGVNGLLISS